MSTSPSSRNSTTETMAEIMSLAQRGIGALETSYAPHGYNVGFNQGRVAGAGVEHHIHMHVVPRWGGDTNFMPVLGDTRVMNQTLHDSYETAEGSVRLTWRSPPRRPAIFKAYDIRGIYGEELDADTAHLIGRAFARVLARLRGKEPSELRVGLGHDMRLSSPEMADGGPHRPGRGGRHRHRRRAGRDRDELLPGRLARARRRRDGHRLAQPQEVHGREAAAGGRPGALR